MLIVYPVCGTVRAAENNTGIRYLERESEREEEAWGEELCDFRAVTLLASVCIFIGQAHQNN